jgi:hypothetical protein
MVCKTNKQCLEIPQGLSDKGESAALVILHLATQDGCNDTGGCKLFYTPQEFAARGGQWGWRNKNGDYGVGTELIVCHDGGAFAKYFNWDYEDYASVERMRQVLEKAGCFAEQCTSWFSAIYPI